jgi:hypothetical protein
MSVNQSTDAREVWIPVAGYERHYEVSSLGRVRSLPRLIRTSRGHGVVLYKGRMLSPYQEPGRYAVVQLSACGRARTKYVHLLVAAAFVPNPNGKPTVNHRNGIKGDNRADNLEWATQSENNQHAHDTGLARSPRGELHRSAKVTAADIPVIRARIAAGESYRTIAADYGVRYQSIQAIRSGRSWSHI